MSLFLVNRPKVEDSEGETSSSESDAAGENVEFGSREEQEEALVALIEHRATEVEHLKQRVAYYRNQLVEAEKRLQDSQSKLAWLRARDKTASSKSSTVNETKSLLGIKDLLRTRSEAKSIKKETGSTSPVNVTTLPPRKGSQPKTELLISGANLNRSNQKTSELMKVERNEASTPTSIDVRKHLPASIGTIEKAKVEKPVQNLDTEIAEKRGRGIKRKLEPEQHKELIQLIGRSSSLCAFQCDTRNQIPSQHKRKLRSLALCPVDGELFVTSALDGVVNLWQLQSNGSAASLLSSTDCISPKERRWPEDIAWHPHGNRLFLVYTADGKDSQVSYINLDKTQERCRVTFLEDKPHSKGVINNITFMPWKDTCFASGGSDHTVILWSERDERSWKPKPLHGHLHSSAICGVVGLEHKHLVLSVGSDKRIVGFDVQDEKVDFKHQIESRCMSVLANPCDYNLVMIQTGHPEKQLRLYDIRIPKTELHSLGWKQMSSETQSALISQSWSPDGFYIASGSADPVIHIFDIRYNALKPFQSIKAHKRRVFKAEWHSSLPLLVSISSDLNIMLHKIT